MKNIGNKKIILLILLLALSIRTVALVASDNFHGIAAGKVIAALRLLEHPDEINAWIVPAHGPIHLYMLAIFIKIFSNADLTARLVSFFCAFGGLVFYYLYVKEIFGKETAAGSVFIAAFWPLHIVYSVLSTAETTFLFFLFAGLFYLNKFLEKEKSQDLFISALLIGIASMCRFEGGLFIVFCGVPLLKKPKNLFQFWITASILPVIWMFCNHLESRDFLHFLSASDRIVQTEFNHLRSLGRHITFKEKFLYWIIQLKSYYGNMVFLGIIGGIGFFGFRKKYILNTSLALILLLFFTLKTVREELAYQPRYGLSIGMLMLPYFLLILAYLLQKIGQRKRVFLVIVVFFIILVRGSYIMLNQLPHTPVMIRKAGDFLKNNMQKDQNVYIQAENDNVKEPLKIYTELGVDQFSDYNPFSQKVALLDPDTRWKLKYIVLISDRKLKNLKQVFSYNKCKIYEVATKEVMYGG